MVDESSKKPVQDKPVFELAEGSVTRLHGAKVPSGVIAIGPNVSDAKAPSPDQSELVVNGAYRFAKQLSKK